MKFNKKGRGVFIAILMLFIVLTLVSGSLAVYQASLDDIDDSFNAAKFVVKADAETLTKQNTINIAPGDKYTVNFTVRNYEGVYISETDMRLMLQIELSGELDPVIVTLYDGETKRGSVKGSGKIDFDTFGAVFAANEASDKTYTLTIEWPDGAPEYDSLYIGKQASYTIRVTGIQTTSEDKALEAENVAKLLSEALGKAAEKDTQGYFVGKFTVIDSTATKLAGIRLERILNELTSSFDNAWCISHKTVSGKDVFDIYVAETVGNGSLRSGWWTKCVRYSQDGSMTHGYIVAKFSKDDNGVSYRTFNPTSFTTDISRIDADKYYE